MLPYLYMRSAEKFLPENPAVGQFQFGLPGQNATPLPWPDLFTSI